MRRLYLWGALVTVASSLVVLGPAPAYGQTPISCGGVLSGANGPLTKSLVSVVNNNNGTFTLTFQLTSTHNPTLNGMFRIRDCAFVDQGGNNAFDSETIIGDDDKNVVVFGGSAQISITVTATADQTVCDRAAISGTDATGTSFTDKSNLLCTPLTQQPPVPEVPYAVILPMAALALFGAAWLIRRRRDNPSGALA